MNIKDWEMLYPGVTQEYYRYHNVRISWKILIRQCKKYRLWKAAIVKRDNSTCQMCHMVVSYPNRHIDHFPVSFAMLLKENNITSLEEAIACDKLWDISGGRVLCIYCHSLNPTTPKNLLQV